MAIKDKNEIIDIQFDDSKILKQSNRLVEAHYSLTLIEQKIIFAIISQLGKNEEDFFTCKIDSNTLADFCGFTSTNKYTRIKNATVKLMRRVVNIRLDNNEYYMSHWVQSMHYKNDGTIIYKLDPDLKPELLQLKKAYLSEESKPLMQFNSQYACRFYLLFKQYLKIGQRKFNLDDIISIFQLNKKTYGRISNLKSRIVDPAMEELNEKSDLQIDYEYIKQKRKITAVNFVFKLKTGYKKEQSNKQNYTEQNHIIKTLTAFGISKNVAAELDNTFSENLILKTIELVKKADKKNHIDNIAGFVIKAIKEDYYSIESISLYKQEQLNTKQKNVDVAKNIIPEFEQDQINNIIDSKSPFAKFLKNTSSKIGNID